MSIVTDDDPDDLPERPREIPPQVQWLLDQFYAECRALREARKRAGTGWSPARQRYLDLATASRERHPEPVRPGGVTFPLDLWTFCRSTRPKDFNPRQAFWEGERERVAA